MSSAAKHSEAAPAVPKRGKKRKVQQQNKFALPEKVVTQIPESALYTQLLEFERKIDATLARKKADVQEARKRVKREPRTLRMYVFNTHQQQVGQEGANNYEPACWTLHIMGRMLAAHESPSEQWKVGPDGQTVQEFDLENDPKFSTFVRSLEIQLDEEQYPESSGRIDWQQEKAFGTEPKDGFEIKRHGKSDVPVKIKMRMHYQPERYKLSRGLSDLLGLDLETRPRIIAALWNYVTVNKLLNKHDPMVVECDKHLQTLFCGGDGAAAASSSSSTTATTTTKFSTMAANLHKHLSEPPPLEIDYVVKCYGDSPTLPECFDLLVDVPSASAATVADPILERLSKDREIEACDAKIAAAVRKIHEHNRRRTFFEGFSHSPVDFINTMVAEQARDLHLVNTQGAPKRDIERRADLYTQPWVDEAVMRYIGHRNAAGQQ